MKVKAFKLFWKTGDTQIVKGRDVAQAMTLAGYSRGALGALDYWEEIKNPDKIKVRFVIEGTAEIDPDVELAGHERQILDEIADPNGSAVLKVFEVITE